MAVLSTDTHVNFPPEFVSPDVKETPEYGLKYAQAMYSSGSRYGSQYYNGGTWANEFDELTALAQGRQSIDGLRNLFGYSTAVNGQADPTEGLSYIDINVLNLAPKYINRVVAKMQKLNYDISLQAVDIVSVNEKEDYVTTIEAFYRLRNWVKDMGYNPQVMFPDIDVAALPEYPDEMLYDLATNPKHRRRHIPNRRPRSTGIGSNDDHPCKKQPVLRIFN